MKHLFLLLFCVISFGQNRNKIDLYENYKTALNTCNSTAPAFLVITFKDLNTNIQREVCIESSDLIFAIINEMKLDFSEKKVAFDFAQKNKKRYFEFSNGKALERLNQYKYSQESLNEFIIEKDVENLSKKIFQEKKWSFDYEDELKKIKYAHALFNFGIITGVNNCFGGETLYCFNWIDY
jgi:hypothetical protein